MRYALFGPATLATLMLLAARPIAAPQQQAGHADTEPKPAAHHYVQPRTPDGQPDLQGFWRHRTVGMPAYNLEGGGNADHLLLSAGCSQGINNCERSYAEVAAVVAGRRAEQTNIIVDPPDGRIPFQPWAAEKKAKTLANHTNGESQYVDPQAKCFLPGVPRMAYQENAAFLITQTPAAIAINYEFQHAYRVIRMDGSPHVSDRIKLWMGDSRGHWEGNTLVVDVTNHNDQTWFDIVGSFHSDTLHVVERWTRVADEQINFEATLEDAQVFTKPWKIALPLTRNATKGYEIMESACIEGVHLEHLIREPAKTAR
jgi:hypothetical protein